MRSTASDLAKWNADLFGGKILKPASPAAMLTPGSLNNGETSGAAMTKMTAAAGAPADARSDKKEYGNALFISQDEVIGKSITAVGFTASVLRYRNFPMTGRPSWCCPT